MKLVLGHKQTKAGMKLFLELSTAYKKGYVFYGWDTTEVPEIITNDTVLKVSWHQNSNYAYNIIISLEPNGGHINFPTLPSFHYDNKISGSYSTLGALVLGSSPSDYCTREGYTAAEQLYLDPEFTEVFDVSNYDTEEKMLTLDGATFYIKWIPNE